MNYAKFRTNPTAFLALTSVCITLCHFFTEAHDEYYAGIM